LDCQVLTLLDFYRLADYLEKEPERQKAKEQKLREKIEKGLKVPEPKKHRFDDPKYFEQTAEMGEDVSTAVLKGRKEAFLEPNLPSSIPFCLLLLFVSSFEKEQTLFLFFYHHFVCHRKAVYHFHGNMGRSTIIIERR
jgi:hypothetical protein